MRKLFAAALLASALLTVPTAYAEDSGAALTCGFASTTDPSSQDPTAQTGEVDAHFSLHNTSGGLVSMTITCTIQINNASYTGTGERRTNTCTPPNPVVAHVIVCNVTDTITYNAAVGDSVYLCTQVTWASSKGGGVYQYDGDDVTAGNQCGLATSVDEIASSAAVRSSRPLCIWVTDQLWACGFSP